MPQTIVLTTSQSTTSTNVLTFSSVPSSLQLGATVTGSGIPSSTYVVAFSNTTVTINNNVTVSSSTVITFTSNAGAVLKVNTDYKIKVPTGGTIRLDTGVNVGQVFITGNLNVQGNTTTVNTTNMEVEDNIILLNKGEQGSSVTEITSGLEIDRNKNADGNAQFLWDESKTWIDPWQGITRSGLWVFKTKADNLVNGILTNSIETMGNNLALISKGTGVITVSGTNNYERQVINYNNVLEIIDDDTIPNIKAVADKIDYQIINNPSDKIKRDDTYVIVYDNNIVNRITSFSTGNTPSTTVTVRHFLTSNTDLNITLNSYVNIVGSGIMNLDGTWIVTDADPFSETFEIQTSLPVVAGDAPNTAGLILVEDVKSNARIVVNSVTVGEFFNTHADIFSVRIQDTTIESTVSNTDLILASRGTGSVRIQDSMKIMWTGYATSATPFVEPDCTKIYTDPEGAGNTGIYFVQPTWVYDTQDFRRDELISKKKAIAFAILM